MCVCHMSSTYVTGRLACAARVKPSAEYGGTVGLGSSRERNAVWPQVPHVDTADSLSICPRTLSLQDRATEGQLPETPDSLRGLCMRACGCIVCACVRVMCMCACRDGCRAAVTGHSGWRWTGDTRQSLG